MAEAVEAKVEAKKEEINKAAEDGKDGKEEGKKEGMKKINKITKFYNDPLPMPRKKLSAQKKKIAEQIRRWRVKITNIYLSVQYEALTPFMQIIIGGNMQKELVKITKEERLTRTTGEVGMAFKTDVLDKLLQGDIRAFKCELEAEVRASYTQIEKEMFHIELWDFQGCSLNILKGYCGKPLLEIVRGDMDITFNIKTMVKKVEVQYATVSMKCVFQEIWDFYITLRDWRTTELIPSKKKKVEPAKEEKKSPSSENPSSDNDSEHSEEDPDDWMQEEPEIRPKLTFTLNSTKSTLYTKTVDGKEPYWSSIEGGIPFRGTVSDINQQIMTLNLYDYANGKTLIGRKTVSLAYVFSCNLK